MKIALTGGAYQAHSVISSAQRSVNLYGEAIPQAEGEPGRFCYYPTAGTVLVHTISNGQPIRGMYFSSANNSLYVVAGSGVFRLDSGFNETAIGTLTTGSGPVSIIDNTSDLIVVDGSPTGYSFDLASNAQTSLGDASTGFYGSARVDYIDTFLIFTQPGSPNFYVSGSLATTFDPLDFAGKTSAPDTLTAAVAARDEIWLLGRKTSEVWSNSGATDFPFQKLPGILVEHGCEYPYSIAKADGQIFFLSSDNQGRGIVLKASGYEVGRVSTNAIEDAIAGYAVISDALGFCYQLQGHTFYVLTFPTADATWVYDELTEQWHEWGWTDSGGTLHRHRANCFANFGNYSLVGDWQNGNIYALYLSVMTDNGAPIPRLRSFPHLINDGKRVSYSQFSADIECGGVGSDGTTTVSLAWSDDRGHTFGNPVPQPMGTLGAYLTQPKWSRLGMARDRVFQLSWTAPVRTALQGAWIDVTPALT